MVLNVIGDINMRSLIWRLDARVGDGTHGTVKNPLLRSVNGLNKLFNQLMWIMINVQKSRENRDFWDIYIYIRRGLVHSNFSRTQLGFRTPIFRMVNWNYWDDQDPSRKNSGPTLQRFWWTTDIVCLGPRPAQDPEKRSKKRSTRYFYWMFPNRNVGRSEPPSNPLDATWWKHEQKTSRSFQICQKLSKSFSPPFCVKLIVHARRWTQRITWWPWTAPILFWAPSCQGHWRIWRLEKHREDIGGGNDEKWGHQDLAKFLDLYRYIYIFTNKLLRRPKCTNHISIFTYICQHID